MYNAIETIIYITNVLYTNLCFVYCFHDAIYHKVYNSCGRKKIDLICNLTNHWITINAEKNELVQQMSSLNSDLQDMKKENLAKCLTFVQKEGLKIFKNTSQYYKFMNLLDLFMMGKLLLILLCLRISIISVYKNLQLCNKKPHKLAFWKIVNKYLENNIIRRPVFNYFHLTKSCINFFQMKRIVACFFNMMMLQGGQHFNFSKFPDFSLTFPENFLWLWSSRETLKYNNRHSH